MWRWIAIGGGVVVVGLAALLLGTGMLTPYLNPASTDATVTAAIPAATGSPSTGTVAAPPKASWATRCISGGRSDTPDCTVEQKVIVAQTRQLLAGLAVTVDHKERKPAMMLQVPVGLYLPAGVSYQFDNGTVQKLPLQTCDQSGCYAGTQVSDDLLQQFMTAQTMTVTFQGLNKQDVKVQVPIAGFAAAYDRVK